MNEKAKILFSWSSGKDSALALAEILRNPAYEVAALLTLIIEEYNQISMHGVRCNLVDRQARAIGLPLEKVFISPHCSDEEYEARMKTVLTSYLNKGITSIGIGDIFLEDVRKYRENNLARIGMQAIFPLWGKNTRELAQKFIDEKFRGIVTCIDSHVLDPSFLGRNYDETFLADLPSEIDPCGENGEFHTFVYDGPIFHHKIGFKKGEIFCTDSRFYFCDLLPE